MKGKKGNLFTLPFLAIFDPPEKKHNYVRLFGVVGVFITLILLAFFAFSSSSTNCDSYQCFLDSINTCENANLISESNGNVYEFSTANCFVDKQVILVSESEPEEIKDLFEGKSMSCDFTEAPPEEVFLDDIFSSLEFCQGPLKESIYELIIAQYEATVTDLENQNDYLLFVLNGTEV